MKFNKAVSDETAALNASALIASITDDNTSPVTAVASNVAWSADKKILTITIPSTTFTTDKNLKVTFKDNASSSVIVDRAGNAMSAGASATIVVTA